MSFRRAETHAVSPAAPVGTRRWLDGQCLVSTGHAALDGALGGGIPLNSLVLLEEDVCGGHASLLASLFAAEALACGHGLCVAGGDGRHTPRSFLEALPLCVSRGSADMASLAAGAGAAVPLGSAATADEPALAGGGEGEEQLQQDLPAQQWDVTGAGLHTAWQYKKYLPPPPPAAGAGGASGGAQPSAPLQQGYCHTFDLGRRVPAASLAASAASALELPGLRVAPGAQEVVARAQLILARGVGASAGQREEDGATLAAAASALQGQGSEGSGGGGGAASSSDPYASLVPGLLEAPAGGSGVKRLVVLGLGGPGWPGCVGTDATTTSLGRWGAAAAAPASRLPSHLPMLNACSALRRALGSPAGAGRAASGGAPPPPHWLLHGCACDSAHVGNASVSGCRAARKV